MKAEEFVANLGAIQIDTEAYAKQGASNQFMAKLRNRYKLRPKNSNSPSSVDPILNLISNYEVVDLEIGMITFLNEAIIDDDVVLIGKFEADSLAISHTTREIVLLSFEDLAIIYFCAQNSDKFLDALLIAAQFLENCGAHDTLRDNQSAILACSNECATVAGGTKYQQFYHLLLGYFEDN